MVDSLDCPKAALRLFTVVVLSAFVPGASGTAQESRPRGAQVHQDEAAVVHIPEPMVFDLVRGLGAVQGEAEVNVLWHPIPGGLGPRQAIVRSIIGCSTEDGRFSLNGASRADFDAVSRSPYPRTETLGA